MQRPTAIAGRLILGMLVFAALAAAAPSDTHAGDKLAGAFARWAARAQKVKGTHLCRYGVSRYRGGRPLYYALFAQQADKDRPLLVLAWGNERLVKTTTTESLTSKDCDDTAKPAVWETKESLELATVREVSFDWATVALVDDQLSLLGTESTESGIDEQIGWEDLATQRSDRDEPTVMGSAMLLVLPAKSRWRPLLPKLATFTTFGESSLSGPEDASLEARVELKDKSLAIEMSAVDDVRRPLSAGKVSDTEFLKADHFEVWFCAAKPSVCDKKGTRQVGVARLADGSTSARWLYPKGNKEPLPAVTSAPGKTGAGDPITITIPIAQMGVDGDVSTTEELSGSLTVAYSDSDTAGKGQETVVASSRLRFADSDTFGRFVRNANQTRFPAWDGYEVGFDTDIEPADVPTKLHFAAAAVRAGRTESGARRFGRARVTLG